MIPKRNVDFYGDQVRWFIGEVKSVDDPLELGRLQVRINGIHSDSQLDIPDAKLPWAQPMVPITEGGTKGIGNNLGIKVGALVFGVFMDGENSQLPFIMGSMPKFEEDSPGGLSTNQLARGTNTITKTPDPVTDEPSSPYAAKYPKNNVYASESGHVIEIDDTQDSDGNGNITHHERIHIFHRSGTFVEMHPNGDVVTHTANGFKTVTGNEKIHVTKDMEITADGNINITSTKGNINVKTPIGKINLN